MSERLKFKDQADRIFLTVDDFDYIGLKHIREDFGDIVHAVKLGSLFPKTRLSDRIRGYLTSHRVDMFLDAKLAEGPNAMPDVIASHESDGYKYISISAAIGKRSLKAAARSAGDSKIVVALPPERPDIVEQCLDILEEANEELGTDERLNYVMADVADIERVSQRGRYVLTATGIYIPGTNPLDMKERMTPLEAIDAGADYLAIGSAVLGARDRMEAMQRALENISTSE